MSHAFSSELPRDPSCGRVARRLLDERLAAEVDAEVLEDAKTVVSELVNNAYQHGTGVIELRLQVLDDRVRVEVVDEGQGASVNMREEGVSGGGRGLGIVQSLACEWGVFEGTTHVWAEIDTESDEADPPL
jgi:anti-sigma regulatory factor (Ser/Thr protein kinase)